MVCSAVFIVVFGDCDPVTTWFGWGVGIASIVTVFIQWSPQIYKTWRLKALSLSLSLSLSLLYILIFLLGGGFIFDINVGHSSTGYNGGGLFLSIPFERVDIHVALLLGSWTSTVCLVGVADILLVAQQESYQGRWHRAEGWRNLHPTWWVGLFIYLRWWYP